MVDWEKYGWIKRSNQRQKIIMFLDGPKTPTDIAEEIGVQLSQISYSLSQFREKGIVEVLNEDATQGRLYKLTDEGKEIKEELESE